MDRNRRAPAAPQHPRVTPAPKAVVLVGNERDWPPELKASLQGDGFVADDVADLSLVPSLLADGRVRALFVFARPLGASELLVLRRVREASPRTAIVVVTRTPTDPDLKRAFESGATAFLSWPASPDALRHAVESGDLPAPPVPSAPMKAASKDTRAAALPTLDRAVTFRNRLPLSHPHRRALEKVFRASLRDLPGRWDVSLRAVGRILIQVDVVAPDGSPWSLAIPVHQGPGAEDIAEAVRLGCARLALILAEPGGNCA